MYMNLLNRKEEIKERSKEIFSSDFWKSNIEDQQIAMQIHIEKLAKKSKVKQILGILPLEIRTSDSDEIKIKLDIECSMYSLTRLLYNISNSQLPLKINKLDIYSDVGMSSQVRAQIELSSLMI